MLGDLYEISGCAIINETDDKKVKELEKSMMENGWLGMPILYMDNILITGSHRATALRNLEERRYDFTEIEQIQWDRLKKQDTTFDVSNVIKFDIDNEFEEIEFDNLKLHFEGTEVEQWASELVEW